MNYQKDYYAILELSHGASDEVIRGAYRALAKKYHPDRNRNDPSAASRMSEINEAYEVLTSPSLKRQYDQRWEEAHGAPPRAAAEAAAAYDRRPAYTERHYRTSSTTSEHWSKDEEETDRAGEAQEQRGGGPRTAEPGKKRKRLNPVGAVIAAVCVLGVLAVAFSYNWFGLGARNVSAEPDEAAREAAAPAKPAAAPKSLTILCADEAEAGETLILNVLFTPGDFEDRTVTWSSSDEQVLRIEGDRAVAAGKGTAVLTVSTPSGVTAEKKVSVSDSRPRELAITGNETFTVGQTHTFKATVTPQSGEAPAVIWGSTNTNVAMIDKTGTLKAKSPGFAVITAETPDGLKAELEISVNPKPVPIENGIVKRPYGEPFAPVKVNAPPDASVYVYFKHRTSSSNDFSMFVRAGTSFEADGPLGSYTVYYAQGTTWYGAGYRFGVGTAYFRSDNAVTLYRDGNFYNGVELTLYDVPGGNMDAEEISESEFPG